MAKQRFNVIFFTGDHSIGDQGYMRWRDVGSIPGFLKSVQKHYPHWRFANIYDKRSRQKLGTITPDKPYL